MSTDQAYAATLMSIIGVLAFIMNMTGTIIGLIGGICNIITFTAPKLRDSPTVFYLLFASVFQIPCFIFIIITRIALDDFGFNLERESIAFCKIRYYFALVWPQLVTYFMLLATVDRYFATSNSAQIRSWSNIKIAVRLSVAVVIGTHLATSHTLVFYTIQNNACFIVPNAVYTVFLAFYLIGIITLIPHIIMLILSVLTLLNLQQMKKQIVPLSDTTGRKKSCRIKRFERQLITIIVIQVILNTMLALLRLGSYTYSLVTGSQTNKTVVARAAEMFSFRLGIALYYFSFALSFYVSTLTSRCFRDVFCKRMIDLYRWVFRMDHH